MKNSKKLKSGFTLVELLAVIGILAIILVIAVPEVNEYISKRKKDNFLTTARNIARQLEYDNLDFKQFTNEKLSSFNLTDLSSSNFDLENSTAYVEDGEIYVNLVGKGTYDGMYACHIQYSSKNVEVSEIECETPSGGGWLWGIWRWRRNT